MKISSEKMSDNYRNMQAMMSDYTELYQRFPTNKEMIQKLDMSEATVKRYKSEILQQANKDLASKFQEEIVIHIEAAIKEINCNIGIFKKIRNKESKDDSTRMTAAKNIEEAHLDIVRIMRDAPQYITNDIPENGERHNNRKTDTDRKKDSVKSISD